MRPNESPWIKQLARTRPVIPLAQDLSTDVLIVGGGIAGVVTAFFTLTKTDKTVVLLEADKIAHGATGHNAGQVTSYFERPLFELVEEFGLERAIDGQRSVESAWTLIDEILATAKLRTPLYRFTGYTGVTTEEQLLHYFKNNALRVAGGLQPEQIVVAAESPILAHIPPEYKNLYTVAPHADILSLLEAKNTDYIACISFQKGCMNSALFTEELVGYLSTKYTDRFSFFEESPVKTVVLGSTNGVATVATHTITASRIILCTNGFENFHITNNAGKEIEPNFHHLVNGRIGYMAGYIEPLANSPTAISYFPKNATQTKDPTGEPYYYLTRRPHEHEGNVSYNLICTGGPEKVLPDQATYLRSDACSDESHGQIDEFLVHNYKNYPEGGTEYAFCWHGLMGYTPNGVRRVGTEPRNPVLMYNLGCNGVGILPSVYGGKRIADILTNTRLTPSIFDPLP